MSIRSRLLQPVLVITFLFIVSASLHGEKWVGQCATYQLLEGTKTESGESFDRTSLAAACNGFRLGSEVDVVNVKNGKSVTVKINNRITSESKYFILLTPKAAREIDMEWETGLVVINADFTDVNSTEILPINGLVSEGSFDEETVKKFPSIKWPDDKGEDIIVEQEVETLEAPLFAEVKTPAEKEDRILLIDGGGPLIKGEKEKSSDSTETDQTEQVTTFPDAEKSKNPDRDRSDSLIDEDMVVVHETDETLTFFPDAEQLRFPDKVMEAYSLDEDTVIVLETGEKLEPSVEKTSKPYRVLKVENLDEDKLDTYTPGIEEFSVPDYKYALLDSDRIGDPLVEIERIPDNLYANLDREGRDVPDEERGKFPQRDYHILLGPDSQDGPAEEKGVFPQRDYDILLGPDSQDGPVVELIKTPDQITRLLDSDMELLPDEERGKAPQKEQDFTYLSTDTEMQLISPLIEDVKIPVYVPTQFDSDFDNRPDVEHDIVPEKDYYARLSDDELKEIIAKIQEDEPDRETLKNPAFLYAQLSDDESEKIREDEPDQETLKNPDLLYAQLSSDDELEKEDIQEEVEYPDAEEKTSPGDKDSDISDDYEVVIEEKTEDQERQIRDEKEPDRDQERQIRDEKEPDQEQERAIREERVVEEKVEEYVEGEAYWRPSLETGKLYIRLYTSFDKAEADSKLIALQALLPGVKGHVADGKYIIFYGPIPEDQANKALEGIRSFGFRDAYIVRMK